MDAGAGRWAGGASLLRLLSLPCVLKADPVPTRRFLTPPAPPRPDEEV